MFQLDLEHIHEHEWVMGSVNPPTRIPGAMTREGLKELSKWWFPKGSEIQVC